MRDLDSYLAGVFDGEGYITAQHKSDTHGHRAYTRLLVGVGMTTPEPVRMFRARFGGGMGRYVQRACVMHQWWLCGSKTIPALALFADLCVVKREQAETALTLARLLLAGRAKGKRMPGERVVSDEEIETRVGLVQRIKLLKEVA